MLSKRTQMKILKNRFDKELIATLPKVSFEGRIVTVISEAEADRAVDYLMSQTCLGFDTETKPSFKKGKGMNNVALLQVSSDDTCFLFRLNRIGLTNSIVRLLSDNTITKVGLSWNDDLRQLLRLRDFIAGTFIELQNYAKEIGIDDMSLQKLYANVFGEKISKSQRLSNWESSSLSESQQVYAAIDAWACVRLYKELTRIKESGDYVIDWGDEEE